MPLKKEIPFSSVLFTQDISGCLNKRLKKNGLSKDFFEDLLPDLNKSHQKIKDWYNSGELPLLHLPYHRRDLEEIRQLAARLQDDFSDIVILGTGGSSLGAQTFYALADCSTPRLHFIDNIDPHAFDVLFNTVNLHTTAFLVISKSGATAETLFQFLGCGEYFIEKMGLNAIQTHFTVITENKSSTLKKIADLWHIPVLEHDPNVGGRFSALSLVGLLPAMIAGLDPIAIREGAASVLDQVLQSFDASDLDMAKGAALSYILDRDHHKSQVVLMPYIERLKHLSLWYRQLWAESLGKQGKGTTPIQALGTVDQHSQLQLYLDGPQDKLFTLLTTDFEGQGFKILSKFSDASLDYLEGATIGDLMQAEQQATIDTLINHGCPTRVIHIPHVNEKALGGLMMHFILETLFAADLYQVNPFDQPAVEEGKLMAKQYLREILKKRSIDLNHG